MNFIILFILLVLSAWFSGMEIAMFSLSSAKTKQLTLANSKKNKKLIKLLHNKHRLLIIILLGNNLVNIGAASLATLWTTEMFGSAAVGVVTGTMTFLILIFGEMYPKAYFQANAEKMAIFFAPFVYFLQIIAFPVVFLLEKLLLLLTKGKIAELVSESEFKALSRLAVEKGVLEFEEHEMIMNILEFNDTKVKEVMTFNPISVDQNMLAAKALSIMNGKKKITSLCVHSKKSKNKTIGIIHIHNILEANIQ